MRFSHAVGGWGESYIFGNITETNAINRAKTFWNARKLILAKDCSLVELSVSRLGLPPDKTNVKITLPAQGEAVAISRGLIDDGVGVVQASIQCRLTTTDGKTSRRYFRGLSRGWTEHHEFKWNLGVIANAINDIDFFGVRYGHIAWHNVEQMVQVVLAGSCVATVASSWTETVNGKTRVHPTSWNLHPFQEGSVVRPATYKVGQFRQSFAGRRRARV